MSVQSELSQCIDNGKGIADWECWGQLKKTTRSTVQTFLRAHPSLPRQDLDAVLKVESEFLDLLSAGSQKTEATWTYKNLPLKRYSFGLLAGAILKDWEDENESPRVKLDAGKLVPDPLPNQLTMAIANWHVQPYDPKSDKMSHYERFSPFIGATLTPEFGIGGGITVKLLRNISVNLGLAAMVVDVPENVSQIGQDADSKDLKSGWGKVAFFGASYSFE